MEGHIGEFQFVIDGSLSSTNRQKKLYRRMPVANRATPVDPERVNAAALCLHGLAFNLLNTFRALAGASDYIDEPPELGLRRARQLLLVPGRIVVSARRATLVIMDAALQSWLQAWRRLEAFHPPPAITLLAQWRRIGVLVAGEVAWPTGFARPAGPEKAEGSPDPLRPWWPSPGPAAMRSV